MANYGYLTKKYCNKELALQVLRSAAGFFIGTCDEESMGISRESSEYFPTSDAAQQALDKGTWTQHQI